MTLPILQDHAPQHYHDFFQRWRKEHPSGVFLNVNGKRALWHMSSCHHLESTDLSRKDWGEAGGSLTKRPKVLGGTVDDLRKWAAKNNVRAGACSHCMGRTPPVPACIEDGFEMLDEADALRADRELAAQASIRAPITTQRIVRDTQLALGVKRLHGYRCQICGETIALPDGRSYAEAHHIRPLGKPHNGPDRTDNILCVCPNHHVGLDMGCFRIKKAKLRTCPGHRISNEHVDYHNSHIYRPPVNG